jgi:hypothetical protein
MDNSADRDMRKKNVTKPGQSQPTKSGDSGSWQKKASSNNEKSDQRTFTEPDNPPNEINKQQTGGPGKPTA